MQTTAQQIKQIWKLAMDLPSDGIARCLPFVGVQAKRTPATKMRVEQIIINCGDFCLRWRCVNGVWKRPEQVSSGAWTR